MQSWKFLKLSAKSFPIDRVLRSYLGRLSAASTCDRMNENLAGAYVERELSNSERSDFERHLIGCGECRTAVVKLSRSARLIEAGPLPFQVSAGESRNRWAARFAYAMAASVLFAAGLLLMLPREDGRFSAPPQAARVFVDMVPQSDREARSIEKSQREKASERSVPEGSRKAANLVAFYVEPVVLPLPPVVEASAASPSLVFPSGNSGRLSGRILSRSNEALPAATLSLVNIGTGAARVLASDADGRFQFSAVPAGKYILNASVGNDQESRVIEVQPERETIVQLNTSTTLLQASLAPSRLDRPERPESEAARLSRFGVVSVSDISSPGTDVESLGQLRTGVGLAGSSLQDLQERPSFAGEIGLIPRSTQAFPAIDHGHQAEFNKPELHAPFRAEAKKTKRVGAKIFQLEGDVWVDQEFLNGSRYPLYQFAYKSPELKSQTKNDFVLKEYLRVGRNVIVVYEKKVIAVMDR